ncbi:MAG TPA: sigma-70 family RNA polymerase sigma factor [Steroidobacteraceae bacterium]|jgi:RNA polymerase sigma-70 factor (ECF subfamily)|nr:sigma-70 family RNA polymerase sigma factor [Steroidobacteraceae bacterium]
MDDKRARFEGQVLPHLDAAYRFARWLCRRGEAEDVVQDAVLRAFRGFDALRGSDAKAWLLTIVRNCHLTAVKQQQRRALVPLPEENDAADGHALIANNADPETETILSDQKKVLQKLVASLPEEHRMVLMLREIEEMDYAQIAVVTNVPIGTVMSRLARSRAALKAKWLQEVDGVPHAVR